MIHQRLSSCSNKMFATFRPRVCVCVLDQPGDVLCLRWNAADSHSAEERARSADGTTECKQSFVECRSSSHCCKTNDGPTQTETQQFASVCVCVCSRMWQRLQLMEEAFVFERLQVISTQTFHMETKQLFPPQVRTQIVFFRRQRAATQKPEVLRGQRAGQTCIPPGRPTDLPLTRLH